jgi:hypothetical protein
MFICSLIIGTWLQDWHIKYGNNSTERVTHCIGNLIYVFPEMKLCGLVPNSYIHASVSDIYIPRIGLPISQPNRQTDPGIYKSLTDT